jgi:hypothetical protein
MTELFPGADKVEDPELARLLTLLMTRIQRAANQEHPGTADGGGIVAHVGLGGALRRIDISTGSRRRLDNVSLARQVTTAIHAAEAAERAAHAAVYQGLAYGGVGLDDAVRDLFGPGRDPYTPFAGPVAGPTACQEPDHSAPSDRRHIDGSASRGDDADSHDVPAQENRPW